MISMGGLAAPTLRRANAGALGLDDGKVSREPFAQLSSEGDRAVANACMESSHTGHELASERRSSELDSSRRPMA